MKLLFFLDPTLLTAIVGYGNYITYNASIHSNGFTEQSIHVYIELLNLDILNKNNTLLISTPVYGMEKQHTKSVLSLSLPLVPVSLERVSEYFCT